MITARDAYYLTYGSIQRDVMIHGPVEASMDVYDDFPSYKSGIMKIEKKCITINSTVIGVFFDLI